MIYLENEDFNTLVKDGVVLVDFFATWCGPCHMLSPVLEELSKKRSDIKIVKVDVDEHEDLARGFGIMSIPTLQLYKEGECIKTKTGYLPLEDLTAWIDEEVS